MALVVKGLAKEIWQDSCFLSVQENKRKNSCQMRLNFCFPHKNAREILLDELDFLFPRGIPFPLILSEYTLKQYWNIIQETEMTTSAMLSLKRQCHKFGRRIRINGTVHMHCSTVQYIFVVICLFVCLELALTY